MKVGVLGGGSWGTALAKTMAENGNEAWLWCRNPQVAEAINTHHHNSFYLSDITLPDNLHATTSLEETCADSGMLLVVTPSHVLRDVVSQAAPYIPQGIPILSASKGIEQGSLLTISEVLEEVLPVHCHPYCAFLGGPSFAKEVAARKHTAVVVASHSAKLGRRIQMSLASDFLRVYTSIDVVGVEFGGALKNVIAVAAGVAEGMGLGLNARAGMVTRGLAEISRLALRKGANPLTLSGLSGMGDLVLTCYGGLSRNRSVGYELGKGKTLKHILGEMRMVAEGVRTAKSAYDLSMKLGVEMPITEQVYNVLYNDKPVAAAVRDLMARALKPEREPF